MNNNSLLHAAGLVLMVIIWIVLAVFLRNIQGKPFPYPWEAVMAIIHPGEASASIYLHMGASILRWGAGFGIAAILGCFMGIAMALSPKTGEIFSPLVHTLQLIPGLAWIPISLILFGLGNTATIFMIAVTAVSPVIINTRAGIREIDKSLIRAAKMMELSSYRTFFQVIIPGAAPSIVGGLRIASANGFRVLISAEMVVGTGIGLGYSLLQARWNLDYEAAFGTVIMIALIGLIFEKLVFYPLELMVRNRRGMA